MPAMTDYELRLTTLVPPRRGITLIQAPGILGFDGRNWPPGIKSFSNQPESLLTELGSLMS